MKKLVIYYSWSGHTETLAKARAQKESADIYQIRDLSKPGRLAALSTGCLSALNMKRTQIFPITAPLPDYDTIIIMAPVWAAHPAPAINNVFDALPPGKDVVVCMVSATGESAAQEKVRAVVSAKGCNLIAYENLPG